MLKDGQKPRGSLVARLLLSTSLIAASAAYGVWQHQTPPKSIAAAHVQPPAAKKVVVARAAPVAPPVDAAPKPVDASRPQINEAPQPLKQEEPPQAVEEAPTFIPNPSFQDAIAGAAPPDMPASGIYSDGEFTGQSIATVWGDVQVKAIVKSGVITEIITLAYPAHRRTSQEISEWAIPRLTTEAIEAQSANVDIVSQASVTSDGFLTSLQTALDQAKK